MNKLEAAARLFNEIMLFMVETKEALYFASNFIII